MNIVAKKSAKRTTKAPKEKQTDRRRFELILDTATGGKLEDIATARGYVQGPTNRPNMSRFLKELSQRIVNLGNGFDVILPKKPRQGSIDPGT